MVSVSNKPQNRTAAPKFAAALFGLRFNRDQKLIQMQLLLRFQKISGMLPLQPILCEHSGA